jgi:hypothetical protein
MPQTPFHERLKDAIDYLRKTHRLVTPRSNNLYTFAKVGGFYQWKLVQNADGLLIASRNVGPSQDYQPNKTSILIGVVIQSEFMTADTKPNPQGKASVSHVETGLWICRANDNQMLRIDIPRVLFVLPKGASPKKRKKYKTTLENVSQAAALHGNSKLLTVPRGISAKRLSKKLYGQVKDLLKVVGRPRIAE